MQLNIFVVFAGIKLIMNSYDLSRKFWDWAYENPEIIKPNHAALYFFIIEHCNRLGWKKKFGLPTTMAKEAIGIRSYNTFINCFNDLANFGFIEILERSKNQFSSNIIALSNFNKACDKALDKAFIKHATKQSESNSTVDKSVYKEPINKKTNNKRVAASGPSDEYKNIIKLWFEFVEKRNGVKPSFTAVDGKSLKSIIAYISKEQNKGQKTEDTFEFILDRWPTLSEWLQSNALDLKIFNSKINTILDQIRNGTGTKQKGFAERVGQYFDATNPDYKDL